MKTVPLKLCLVASLLSIAAGMIAGCGSGMSGESSSVTSLASVSSRECFSCHATNQRSVSTASGVNITAQWQLSAHNTAEGAGCVDCHGYHYQYITPASCRNCHAAAHGQNGTSCSSCHGGGSKELADCTTCHDMTRLHQNPPIADPDSAGKCFGCHNNGRNFKISSIGTSHFNNFTGAGIHAAMYVTTNYQKSCSSCHEPHNPLLGLGSEQRTAWARSGHGDVNGVAWANRDFKQSVDCIRCHTATGFINYAESNFTLPQSTWAAAGDKKREVLTCRACHLSSNFKNSIRQLGAFSAPYNSGNSPLVFKNVGLSNLCIPCHSGREGGASINAITSFTNVSFKNAHYLAAAAVFYGKGGFKFYTSDIRYPTQYGVKADGVIILAAAATAQQPAIAVGDEMVGRKANWNHGRLGMENYLTTTNATVTASGARLTTGTDGQCLACHMGGSWNSSSHSYGALETANASQSGSTYTRGCYGCHNGTDMPMSEFIEEEKVIWDRLFDFFIFTLQEQGIYYNDANYPYFFKSAAGAAAGTSSDAIKNWTTQITGGSGAKTMGACQNLKLLKSEKGSFVHNRSYGRLLIFDSIQYLQTGTTTYSNSNYTATGSVTDKLSFTAYSTAVHAGSAGVLSRAANPTPINGSSGLKGYLQRTSSGKNYRR